MHETFEHTADIGLRVRADSLDHLFEEAASGLSTLLVENLEAVRPVCVWNAKIQGPDPTFLLLDWLDELLYQWTVKHLIFIHFSVQVTDDGLAAQARGEAFEPARHRADFDIKAITYHGLKVEREGQGWLAEVIVDI